MTTTQQPDPEAIARLARNYRSKLAQQPTPPKTAVKPPVEVAITTEEVCCRACSSKFTRKTCVVFGTSLGSILCPPCEQKRLDARVREEADRMSKAASDAALRETQRWAAICPWEFRTTSEGGNTDLERLKAAQPKFEEALRWTFRAKGLILRSSASGTCKTRTMFRLLRRLFDEGHSMACFTAGDFDRSARDAGGNYTLTAWFDRLCVVDVVFIDDLGKGQWSPATEGTFFDLVDKRTREGRPLLITTNEDGDSLSTALSDHRGSPLVRRLRDYCHRITFDKGNQ